MEFLNYDKGFASNRAYLFNLAYRVNQVGNPELLDTATMGEVLRADYFLRKINNSEFKVGFEDKI